MGMNGALRILGEIESKQHEQASRRADFEAMPYTLT